MMIDHAEEIEDLVREIREFVWGKVNEVISHVLEIQAEQDDEDEDEHCPFCGKEMWPHKEWWKDQNMHLLVWSCSDCKFNMAKMYDEEEK